MVAMVAGAAFAADANASVYMTGNLASGAKGSATKFFTLTDQNQKDADLIQFSFNGEKAGASFKLWSDIQTLWTGASQNWSDYGNMTSSLSYSDGIVRLRSIGLWFKPAEAVKVSVGSVGQYLYTERLHWWKVAVGNSASNASNWGDGGQWSNQSGCEGFGANVTLTPIAGLSVDLGVAPGLNTSYFTGKTSWSDTGTTTKAGDAAATYATDGTFTYCALGATIKYQITEDISAGAGYRDAGTGSYKIVTIGADYGKYGAPVYEYIQPRFHFNKDFTLEGIAFDNYGYFTAGAFKLSYRFPFTLRLTTSTDPSYLIYDVKAEYAMDGFTPYIEIGNDDGCGFKPLTFGDGTNATNAHDSFVIDVHPGVSFSVGECALDVSAEFWKTNDSYGWQLPFTARVSF